VASELGTQRPSWILLTPRFAASAHVVILLLKDGKVRLVAKIARAAGDEGPRHEARMLAALSEAGVPPGAAPRVVATADLAGHGAVLEEAVHGRPLDRRLLRADPGRWIGSVVRWLEDLPRAPRDAVVSVNELVRDPLERLRAKWPQDSDLAALVVRTLGLLAPLERRPLPAVFEHGDLSHPNLLVHSDGGLGVLDWELARPDGMPLHDLSFFLGYVALATFGDRGDPYTGLERVLADRTWGAVPALHAEAARFGIDRAALPALIVTCWARAFAGLVERASAGTESGAPSSSRYYRMWAGAVDRTAQLGALIV
jgi:aminoglycoside phosphotransferase (APT) family kinase protein